MFNYHKAIPNQPIIASHHSPITPVPLVETITKAKQDFLIQSKHTIGHQQPDFHTFEVSILAPSLTSMDLRLISNSRREWHGHCLAINQTFKCDIEGATVTIPIKIIKNFLSTNNLNHSDLADFLYQYLIFQE